MSSSGSSSGSKSASSSTASSSDGRAPNVVGPARNVDDQSGPCIGLTSIAGADAPMSSGRQDPTSRPLLDVDEAFLRSLTGPASTCTVLELGKLKLGRVDLLVPEADHRPWRAPEGYFTVYEGYFSCGLRFPLPELLLDYCDKKRVALSQLAPSSVSNMITLQSLGRECGVEIDLSFFDGATSMSSLASDSSLFYVKMKPGLGIICGAPNKIRDWKLRFFYVKKNEASVLDSGRAIRSCWSRDVGSLLLPLYLFSTNLLLTFLFFADRRPSKPLTAAQKIQADRIREISRKRFPEILASRAEKSKRRRRTSEVSARPVPSAPPAPSAPSAPSSDLSAAMLQEGDYFFRDSDEEVEEAGGQLPEAAEGKDGGDNVVDPPPTQIQTNQTPAEVAGSKRKRSRANSSTSGGRSSLPGRHIHYSEPGFVDDKGACASVMYALKHLDAPTTIPPLSELEESEEYAEYARSEMRNQARLNKMLLSYQKKLTDARQALKDADHLEELKADLKKQQVLVADATLKLQEQKKENDLLRVNLAAKTEELKQSAGRCQKACDELRSLGGYSRTVRARADRLRKRLAYLDKVKDASKQADQARSNLACVQDLFRRKMSITPERIAKMEKKATDLEAEAKKVAPFVLEAEDLAPLEMYVPVSQEFGELLRNAVPLPPVPPPPAHTDVIEGIPGVVQDPPPVPQNEGGGDGRTE